MATTEEGREAVKGVPARLNQQDRWDLRHQGTQADQGITVVEAVRQALTEEMERDPRVMVLGQDVARKGGVFLATEGLLERFGPERVLDTPISESLIVGVAIGASLNGMIPVAEIQFADYIYPGIDQIVNEAAKMRYR